MTKLKTPGNRSRISRTPQKYYMNTRSVTTYENATKGPLFRKIRKTLAKYHKKTKSLFISYTPIIHPTQNEITRWEDIPWPPQTDDIEAALKIIEEKKKRTKQLFLSKDKRKIYKDLADETRQIEEVLWEKRQRGEKSILGIR